MGGELNLRREETIASRLHCAAFRLELSFVFFMPAQCGSFLLSPQAYAKLHGTYESINGGSVGEALVDLTGGCCEKISFTSGEHVALRCRNTAT